VVVVWPDGSWTMAASPDQWLRCGLMADGPWPPAL